MKAHGLPVAAVVAIVAAVLTAAMAQDRPALRLPPISQPPKIDGVVSPGEWDGAFHSVGFISNGAGVIDPIAAECWFGYDKQKLYFAVRQEVPPDGQIRGKKRRGQPWGASTDEHVEILIDPSPASPDQTRFQFMGNVCNFITELGHNDRIGGFVPFSGQWTVANKVEGKWWTQEMSTPISALGQAQYAPGATWGVFMGGCRDASGYYGWPLAAFLIRSRYLQVTFDEASPVVHVTKLGPWEQGIIEPELAVSNPGRTSLKLKAAFILSDPKAELTRQEQPLEIAPGATGKATWNQALPKDGVGSLRILLTDEAGKITYFDGPYAFGKARQPKWPDRPKEASQAVAFSSFFYPGFCRVRNVVDFSNLPEANAVTKLAVTVTGSDNKELAHGTADHFEDGVGWSVLDLPKDLAEGTYKVSARLFAGEKPVEPALVDTFRKTHFPFEGNRLGITDQVPPPWTPLAADAGKGTLSCWGRTHILGPDGLPQQIETAGEPILAGPIYLRIRDDAGRWATLAGKGLSFIARTATGSEVDARASAGGPGIDAGVALHAEFDGMLKYTLTLNSAGAGKINALDLVVPIRPQHAWLLHATSDGCRTNYSHYTPKGTGSVWDSRAVMNCGLTGTFIPQVWLGDDERGLAWWADSEKGWVRPAARKDPAIEVVRDDQSVSLVLHLVARPFQFTGPRTIVFAFTATPTKPKASWARSITGSSKQGSGLNGPYVTWFGSCCWALTGVDRYKGWPYVFTHMRPVSEDAAAWLKDCMAKVHAGGRIGLAYTDIHARSTTAEAKYYAWEWNPNRDDPSKAAMETAKPYDCIAINTAASRIDHDLWCIDESMKLGMDAWYFDEVQAEGQVNPAAGLGFLDDEGNWQAECRLFALRDFLKRLYVLMRQRGQKEPLIVIHNTSTTYAGPFAFATALFDMELCNTDPNKRHLTMCGLDYLMAQTMGHQHGLIATCLNGRGFEQWITPERGLGDCRVGRHWVGTHWLMNMRPYLACDFDEAQADRIMAEFGYQDANACRWVPFWRADGDLQAVSPSTCKVSLYRHGGSAMLVILNDGPKDAVVQWKPTAKFGFGATPQDPQRENESLWEGQYSKPDGTWMFFVPAFDYRFIKVNANGKW
jgi:hypothetical protein